MNVRIVLDNDIEKNIELERVSISDIYFQIFSPLWECT